MTQIFASGVLYVLLSAPGFRAPNEIQRLNKALAQLSKQPSIQSVELPYNRLQVRLDSLAVPLDQWEKHWGREVGEGIDDETAEAEEYEEEFQELPLVEAEMARANLPLGIELLQSRFFLSQK